MSDFDWKNEFDLGVQSMNTEHKHLLGIMARLHESSQNSAPKSSTSAIINELYNYTLSHFGDEERFMQSINFPEYQRHRVVHKDLITKLTKYKHGFETSSEIQLSPNFVAFLKRWLTSHIATADHAYGDFSNARVKKAA